jgi:hypothetical protein
MKYLSRLGKVPPGQAGTMSKKRSKNRKSTTNSKDEKDLLRPAVPDADQLLRESDRFTSWMVGIFLGIAAILGLVAILSGLQVSRRQTAEIRVLGEVVDLMSGTDETEEVFYFPVVQFPLQDGTRLTVQLSQGSSSRDYEPGDSVTVRYLPDDPEKARIQSFWSTALLWVLPVITGGMSAAFFAITMFAWGVFRREKNERHEG